MIDSQERAQWQELRLAQVQDMISDQVAKDDLAVLVGDFERAVVFGQSFVEPHRHGWAHRVFYQEMNVLVKDRSEGVLLRSRLGGQGDVVDVFARLKVTGHVLIDFEWLVRPVTLKDNHSRWHR